MHLPHLQSFKKQSLLFLTVCTAKRRPLLANSESHEVLRTVWTKSAGIDDWYIGRYLLMPDHVHFFARPGFQAKPLADWMKSWKSISSRRIAISMKVTPPAWQSEYFDHFVRSAASYQEKWDYGRANPVRAGLVSRTEDWPFQGVLHDLEYS